MLSEFPSPMSVSFSCFIFLYFYSSFLQPLEINQRLPHCAVSLGNLLWLWKDPAPPHGCSPQVRCYRMNAVLGTPISGASPLIRLIHCSDWERAILFHGPSPNQLGRTLREHPRVVSKSPSWLWCAPPHWDGCSLLSLSTATWHQILLRYYTVVRCMAQ